MRKQVYSPDNDSRKNTQNCALLHLTAVHVNRHELHAQFIQHTTSAHMIQRTLNYLACMVQTHGRVYKNGVSVDSLSTVPCVDTVHMSNMASKPDFLYTLL